MAIWVTKAGLVFDVKNQAEKFTDLRVKVVSGTKAKRVKTYTDIQHDKEPQLIVVSYETYRSDIHHFDHLSRTLGFDIALLDEAH